MSVKILVVRPDSVSLEDFNQMGITVEGVAPEDVTFVHVEVEAGETPDTIHERVEAALVDGEFDTVYIVEDHDAVTKWLEDTCIGDWRDLDVGVATSEGFVVTYLPGDADEADDADDDDN